MKTIEGRLDASGLRFGLIASRFNSLVVDHMVGGAEDILVRNGADGDDLTLVRVPGSFEIPLAAQRMAASGRFDAVIALGAVIRGSTPHFDYVAAEVSKGLAQVQMESGVPVGYGIITTDTLEQAIERAGTKAGNKGADAAMAALEMVRVMGQLEG
ncbi:6,7-dimethyl-8-ribityllumazine synthase [Thiohalorhabdus denitrificans]|uniref:6,7-dimethyl-8-ribityllumazine synthase n=1 Tax=Thiohalorhabdus denitrificans TaxID=381306 RepID=A0A0P9EPZ6_9GAMM|nr:6,7-dimethyl-8-ribityllumazine synthase [Thiohalorhabdus denitrificans]KPV40575.1 6,7-dimethyl-8-ribityllumazine synthase [Thiohalorhabdus denitrificans]SCY50744.1 6,7-dimethyl-8-ribityllumazine synthase [Thiohalorhabdus denitrificans]